MKIFDNLSKKTCESILQSFLKPYAEVSNYNLVLWNPLKSNKYYTLKIHSERKCYSYLLYKLPSFYNEETLKYFTDQNKNFYLNTLWPTFFVKNGDEPFLGFEDTDLQNFTTPENLDLGHMLLAIQTLAEHHADCVLKSTPEQNHLQEHDRKISARIITRLHNELNHQNIDEESFGDDVNKLLTFFEERGHRSTVQSLGNFEENKLFMYSEENIPIQCKILCVSAQRVSCPLFEFLTLLFATEEDMRKKHFQVFLNHYFDILKQKSKVRPLRKEYELEVKNMLIYVKLEKALYLAQTLLPAEYLTGTKEMVVQNAVNYFKSNKFYKKTLTNLIEHISEHIQYPFFSREDCYEVMRNKLKSTNFQQINFELRRLKVRNGILGDYFDLEVDVKCNNEHKHFQFFLKTLPTDNETSKEITEGGASEKEDFFYNTLLLEFRDCGLETLLDFVPKCYFSRINDFIVLEDITKLGFATETHRVFYTFDQLLLTIKQLAKLHGCSILYEEIQSKAKGKTVRMDECFDSEYFREMLFQVEIENDTKMTHICTNKTIIDHILDLYPDVPKKLSMAEFKRKATYALECYMERIQTSVKYRNVVSHNDLWSTNILFKRDRNGKNIDCRLVDFQLIRYCPPAKDLMALFFLTTDQKTRKKHMDNLVNFYYSELTDILKDFGCDISDIYPYEIFKECCMYMKVTAVCQGLMHSQIVLCPREERQAFYADKERYDYNMMVDRGEFIHERMKDELYRKTFRELVEDLYEICENDYF